MRATSSLCALVAITNPFFSTASPLQARQQAITACDAPTSTPYDTSVYAKQSYICNTSTANSAPATTVNITYSVKTLDTPLGPAEILAALKDASASPSLTENTTATSQNAKVVIQPFQCDGRGGWNNRKPTKEELSAALSGLQSLVQTSLRGKTIASAIAVLDVGKDHVAGVQILRQDVEFVPLNAQCR